jgi:hypothetical protein
MSAQTRFLFFTVAIMSSFVLANCGKQAGQPVATIKSGGGNPAAHSFDQFIYNERLKAGEKHRYSGTANVTNYLDLGFVSATDKNHEYKAAFLLTLLRNGEYHLFYTKLLYFVKSDQSICQAPLQVLKKQELQGKWTLAHKVVTLTDLGTITQGTGDGTTKATLQFGTSATPHELSQKSISIQTLRNAKALEDWQGEQGQQGLTDEQALANLDKAGCSSSTPTAESFPNFQSK